MSVVEQAFVSACLVTDCVDPGASQHNIQALLRGVQRDDEGGGLSQNLELSPDWTQNVYCPFLIASLDISDRPHSCVPACPLSVVPLAGKLDSAWTAIKLRKWLWLNIPTTCFRIGKTLSMVPIAG